MLNDGRQCKSRRRIDNAQGDEEAGRLLTPDGLRMICSANEYDPEKIGIHMLTVLANWNKIDVTE